MADGLRHPRPRRNAVRPPDPGIPSAAAVLLAAVLAVWDALTGWRYQ